MSTKKKTSVGLIGYRNHAEKLLKILKKNPAVSVDAIFHPSKVFEDANGTNYLSALFPLDAIIISSPNQTHYEYLSTLLEKSNCYLYCEKPPVTSIKDLDQLSILPEKMKQRIYFGFNYRFNYLSSILSDAEWMKPLGKLIHISVVSTHGLAFNEQYINSWRADNSTNPHAVLETVGIHYLDLMTLHFGIPDLYQYLPFSHSQLSKSMDTAQVRLTYPHPFTADLLFSYAAPFRKSVEITGTNGYLIINDQSAKLFNPRDTFDENGRFAKPPIMYEKLNHKEDYANSLECSVSFFIDHVKQKKPLPDTSFDTGIESNRLVLKLTDSFHQL
jgi:predicted dehydrogenase